MISKIDARLSGLLFNRPRNITSHSQVHTKNCDCVFSDIVKRRSIRVWDLQSNLRNLIPNLQIISALVQKEA